MTLRVHDRPRLKARAVLILTCLLILLAIFLRAALRSDLRTVVYTIESDKIASPVRLALITDLHSCGYGENMSDLIGAMEAAAPDAVLLGGDIFDDELPHDNAFTFISEAAERWPCYYVSGNHEYWSRELHDIKAALDDAGVTVLEGTSVELTVGGNTLLLAGVDDPDSKLLDEQLAAVSADAKESGLYAVLLSHRPELIERYRQSPFDLVLCGHAHGGQWRLPGLINGLYAPGQGLFPKYAGGQYALDDTTMIVSRGLARETTWVPRIFNRPELVIIGLS
ncbi:MAG: metallophosphoesterase [Clostridia bacterium]|nr:metallophosphoesterase [Clostridia bacterium]